MWTLADHTLNTQFPDRSDPEVSLSYLLNHSDSQYFKRLQVLLRKAASKVMHSSFSKAALNQSRLSACPDASSPSASAQIPSSYSCTKVKSWISVPVSSESSPGLGAGPSIRSTEPFAPACCSIISKTVPHASFRAPRLPYFFCKQLRIFPGEPRRRCRSRCSHNNLHAGLFTKIREFIKKEKSNFSSVSSI